MSVSEVRPLSPISKEQEELAGKGSSRVCQQLQGATYSPCWGEEEYFPLHGKQSRHLRLSRERMRCANSTSRALKQSTALQTAPFTALPAPLSRVSYGFGALISQHQLPLRLPALLVGHICVTSHPLKSSPPLLHLMLHSSNSSRSMRGKSPPQGSQTFVPRKPRGHELNKASSIPSQTPQDPITEVAFQL